MKRLTLTFLAMSLLPLPLLAGPIYGNIFLSGAALRGASLSVTCPGANRVTGSTLDDGSYRIAVPKEGRCTIAITSPNFAGPAIGDVVSLPNAAEYNFAVVPKAGGGYELRRR